MASTRSAVFSKLDTLLSAITGIISHGHGAQWPDLTRYTQAQLPLAWAVHGEDNVEVIPLRYRHIEAIAIRIYYLDWDVQSDPSDSENWIEKLIEKVESDSTLTGEVNFVELKGIKQVERNYPISWVECRFRVAYHTEFASV